jgi:protein phosphatase
MLEIAGLSDRGRVRSENQDRWGVVPLGNGTACAALVADGMGGHVGGAEAARVALDAAANALRAAAEPPAAWLGAAFATADRAVAQLRTGAEVRGTTLVAAVVDPTSVTIANIGDSRAYILDPAGILQVTQDHSALEEYVRSGAVSEAEAQHLPGRNVLTRAVTGEGATADVFHMTLPVGSVLLLCSDGLWGHLTDAQLHGLFDADQPLVRTLTRMCDAALDAGSTDNVTAVACRRL